MERGIVEGKFTVDIEDSNARRQLIEYAAVRLGHAREFIAHDFDLCTVDRNARGASSARRINDLKDAAAPARCNCWQFANVCLAGDASAGEFRTRGLVEQSQPACYSIGRSLGLHRARISRIYEDQ